MSSVSQYEKYEAELAKFIETSQSLAAAQKQQFRKGKRSDRPNLAKEIHDLETLLNKIVLEILLMRDAIQAEVSVNPPPWEDLFQLARVDEQCKALANSPEWANRVNRLRTSFKPKMNEKCWWWFAQEPSQLTRSKKRWNWLLRWTANIIWVLALSILIDISTRVIAGMPDILGTGAVLVNALLGVLVGRGILTGTSGWVGQQIESLEICKQHEREIQLVLAIAVFLLALTIHQDLPIISAMYFNKAEALYVYHQDASNQTQEPVPARQSTTSGFFTQMEIPSQGLNVLLTPVYQKLIGDRSRNAQADYYRATKLYPSNWKAHNRLGEIYEDQENLPQAVAAYQVASEGNLPASLINLSRYYILQDNSSNSPRPYLTAIGLLKRADGLIDQKKKQLWQQDKTQDPQWQPEIVLDEYNRRFHEAWAYVKLFQASASTTPKPEQLSNAMALLSVAVCVFQGDSPADVIGKCEQIERNMKRNTDPTIISEKFAHCVRVEVMDAYRSAKLPPDESFGISNSEDDRDACARTIARNHGTLRSYEAGWWTRATETEL